MSLLKQNKASDKVEVTKVYEVNIKSISESVYKDKAVLNVTLLTDEGEIAQITVGKERHSKLKVGPAALVQTKFNDKAKFAGVMSRISNY